LGNSSGERGPTASVSFWKGLSRNFLEGRYTMISNEELMQCLIYYGRGIPQDLVARSHSINDVIYYLRVECEFEILKLTSFVTTNLVNFEKRTVLSPVSRQTPRDEDIEDIFDVDNPG
jgi:hypothetical protein